MSAPSDEALLEAAGWKPDRFGEDRIIWKRDDLALEKTDGWWRGWSTDGWDVWQGQALTEDILSRPRPGPAPDEQEPEM